MARMILVVAALTALETAWALFCAEASVNLVLFYVVLVAASAVFFVPGIAYKGGGPPENVERIAETKR